MRPLLAVIRSTSSFEQFWPQLADSVGADLRYTGSDLKDVPLRAILIVSAGGAEADAVATLGALAGRATAGRHPVAVVGSLEDHRLSIALLKHGADDYFALPTDLAALRAWIVEHVEAISAEAAAASLTAHQRQRYDYSQVIGASDALRRVLELASRVTPHRDATVLLTGETGTGKELIAKAIHYNGSRGDRPFVEINCSALPANLLEAELFGFEPGAFTDARMAKPGLFEVAESGTLFLDEIGDLPLDLQGKLLRVLEEKRVRRLGSTVSRTIDARIIAATHVDLRTAVFEKRFREDLYYRLNVFPIHLPPLRERGDDILVLAEYFLDRFARHYGMPTTRLNAEMRAALHQYQWPGNIRELRNVIERSVLLHDGRLALDAFTQAPRGTTFPMPFPADMETIQRGAAEAMVTRCHGNKKAAAHALGISRKRLYALLGGTGDSTSEHMLADEPSSTQGTDLL